MLKLDTAIANLESKLASRTYEKVYTNIPNEKLLNSPVKKMLSRFLAAVGEELNNSDSYLTVKSEKDSGAFYRLYAPTVYAGEEEPILRFSPGLSIPLSKIENAGLDIDFDKQSMAVFVPGNEDQEGDDMIVTFRVFTRENGDDAPSAIELKTAYKQGKLNGLLGEAPKRKERFKLQDLEDGTVLSIVGYTEMATDYGTMFVLKASDGREFLGNTAIKKVLAASPTISPEMPAELEIFSRSTTRNGKPKVNCALQCSPGAFGDTQDIDLDF